MSEKFSLNIKPYLDKAKNMTKKVTVDSISISLPFLSVSLSINKKDKKIAKEIIIRLRDKRVLNATECCKNCINNSLKSLQEIREILVDKQVEISDVESPLFLLIDFKLYGIKKLLTYSEELDTEKNKEEYFEALQIVRTHILKTLDEVAKIADISTDFGCRYNVNDWTPGVYLQ